MGNEGSEAVTGPLSELTAELRAEGMRLGVGELLDAHRALAAIDPASREDARLALRTVLCSSHADLERFERAFVTVFGDVRPPGRPEDPLEELGAIERAALPRMRYPRARSGLRRRGTASSVPAAWSDVELLRTKDFARVHGARDGGRARR